MSKSKPGLSGSIKGALTGAGGGDSFLQALSFPWLARKSFLLPLS